MKRHICHLLFVALIICSCQKENSDSQGYSFTKLANISTTNATGGFLHFSGNIQYFSYSGGEWWEYNKTQNIQVDRTPAPLTNCVNPFIINDELYIAGYIAEEAKIKIQRYNSSTFLWSFVTQADSYNGGLKYLFPFGNKVYFSVLNNDYPQSIFIDLTTGNLSNIGQHDYFLNRRTGTYG